MTIQCLSLWQPWAKLLAHGKKRIETRSWKFPGRLPCVLAVHAAKRWGPELATIAVKSPFRRQLAECGIRFVASETAAKAGWGMPFGAVVGLVRLVRCLPTDRFFAGMAKPSDEVHRIMRIGPEEFAFGDFNSGRFGWICDRFHPLPLPIALRGQQGVFPWYAPADVIEESRRLMEG